MKKTLSLILALIMALTCGFAAADTVSLKMEINPDAVGNAMTALGLPEEALASVNPVFSLVNALSVSVMTQENGGEFRLDLNGKEWLSLGFGVGEDVITVVTSLFPNYALNIPTEILNSVMDLVKDIFNSDKAPETEEAEAGDQEMAAIMENLTAYSMKLIEAFTIAAAPEEPIPGEYEMEGIVFDTLTPVTVDIAAIAAAYGEFMEDLLHDEALMGIAQTYMQMYGMTFDEEECRAAMDEIVAHFPDAVSAEVYSFSDGQPGSFVSSQAFYVDRTDPSYAFTMIDKGDGIGTMAYYGYDQQMIIGVEYAPEGFRFDFTMGDVFFGMEVATDESGMICRYFCMDPAVPVLTVTLTRMEDGIRSQPAEAGEKTVVTLEDLLNSEGEGFSSLMGDLMTNGLGGLMEGLNEAAPDLMAMLMPSAEEEEPMESTPLDGGWTVADDPMISEELQAALEKALDGLVGVAYQPVACLGTQVVAGVNYAILCQQTAIVPDAEPTWVIVYLYEDLQGNAEILNVADLIW